MTATVVDQHAFGLQRSERFTKSARAHPEVVAELRLDDVPTRFQLPGDDLWRT